MSTRCRVEFKRGSVRRTVYRHWDGVPERSHPGPAGVPRVEHARRDVEYAAANFLFTECA